MTDGVACVTVGESRILTFPFDHSSFSFLKILGQIGYWCFGKLAGGEKNYAVGRSYPGLELPNVSPLEGQSHIEAKHPMFYMV